MADLIAPPNGWTIDHKTREPDPRLAMNPSSAWFQYQLAAAKRDHGDLGMSDMTRIEIATLGMRSVNKTIMNPFTGEKRKVIISKDGWRFADED